MSRQRPVPRLGRNVPSSSSESGDPGSDLARDVRILTLSEYRSALAAASQFTERAISRSAQGLDDAARRSDGNSNEESGDDHEDDDDDDDDDDNSGPPAFDYTTVFEPRERARPEPPVNTRVLSDSDFLQLLRFVRERNSGRFRRLATMPPEMLGDGPTNSMAMGNAWGMGSLPPAARPDPFSVVQPLLMDMSRLGYYHHHHGMGIRPHGPPFREWWAADKEDEDGGEDGSENEADELSAESSGAVTAYVSEW